MIESLVCLLDQYVNRYNLNEKNIDTEPDKFIEGINKALFDVIFDLCCVLDFDMEINVITKPRKTYPQINIKVKE